jgi:AAA domain, putative AbiEii toxin, Type IV TA system
MERTADLKTGEPRYLLMSKYVNEITVGRMAQLGGGHWTVRGLNDFTVLFGKNGSGKSVMLRAWRDQDPNCVHYVVPERTGEMDFQPNLLQQESDGMLRKNAAARNFVPDYRRRIVGRIQSYFLTRGNTRGDVAPAGDPSVIEQLVESLVPDFTLSLVNKFPPFELTRNDSGEKIVGVDQLSSGEAQMLTLGLDILTISSLWEIQNTRQRILLVDEPDAHLHPDLLVRLAEFLVHVAGRFRLQIVVSTHSTALLAALGQFGGEKTSVVYLQRKQAEYTATRFDAVTKELASCLGGHVLMGPLFGAPLLLVEGDDDYRIWSQVPRHHETNFAVIPTNGEEIKRYQKVLEGILACLHTPDMGPLGYALLDGDVPLPQPQPTAPQDFVRFVKLNCHEAENLYLTAEVLHLLGTGWREASASIREASGRFGAKAQLLADAPLWDRRTVDLKGVINQVAEILDPRRVLWTVRVGATLGRQHPTGELADFLGASVVGALWK